MKTTQPEHGTKTTLGTTTVVRKLRRGASHGQAPVGQGAAEPTSAQIAAAVDSVGRLQDNTRELNTRLAGLLTNLTPRVVATGTLSGSQYQARMQNVPQRKLLPSQKIMTLLMHLLSEVEERNAEHGGLFDLILELDEQTLNNHLMPLLDAVFEKTGLAAKADKLYVEVDVPSLVVEKLPD